MRHPFMLRDCAVLLTGLLCSFVSAKCRGDECDRFKCSSEPFLPRPIDPYLRPGATFHSPCSCLPDWNSLFCNQTQALLSAPNSQSLELPTVCICRKFDDNNSKCQQFISRCFNRRNNECSCCFNQPSNHCDHLKCNNGEPDFGSSNTTCVCHHNPADYPYQICKSLYAKESVVHIQEPVTRPQKQRLLTLLGVSISTSIIWYSILALLVLVALMTIVMLIVGNRKLKRRREETTRQRQAAHEALLMQRADEDRYLPTV